MELNHGPVTGLNSNQYLRLHQNIRSLTSLGTPAPIPGEHKCAKVDEIYNLLIADRKNDIALTETWLDDSIPPSAVHKVLKGLSSNKENDSVNIYNIQHIK